MLSYIEKFRPGSPVRISSLIPKQIPLKMVKLGLCTWKNIDKIDRCLTKVNREGYKEWL